ncbi:MAG: hypothetical protein JXR41_04085 [Bacteroidales bacterium]|nr:hypothetical protein [Bacteroidales bacterium]
MIIRILYWFPRILAICAILFMMMFSLDVFGGTDTAGKKIAGFLMHNIPTFLLLMALIIAWRSEKSGGLIFILLFFALGIFYKSFSGNTGSLVILFPVLLTGIMFIIHSLLSIRRPVATDGNK